MYIKSNKKIIFNTFSYLDHTKAGTLDGFLLENVRIKYMDKFIISPFIWDLINKTEAL